MSRSATFKVEKKNEEDGMIYLNFHFRLVMYILVAWRAYSCFFAQHSRRNGFLQVLGHVNPFNKLDKSRVLQEARSFNDLTISPKNCCLILTKIVFLIYQVFLCLRWWDYISSNFFFTKISNKPGRNLSAKWSNWSILRHDEAFSEQRRMLPCFFA